MKFLTINGLNQTQIPLVQASTHEIEDEGDDESDMEITAKASDIMPRPEDKSVKLKIELYTVETERPSRNREITPTPGNSPDREENREELLRKLEIRFISSQDDKIPDSLSPMIYLQQ